MCIVKMGSSAVDNDDNSKPLECHSSTVIEKTVSHSYVTDLREKIGIYAYLFLREFLSL